MTVNFRANAPIAVQNTTVSELGNSNTFHANRTNLEHIPNTDTVEIGKKNKRKKTLIAIGIATLLGAGAVAGLREAHIKKAQQTFQEVFMRDDISRKETVAILKRYKNIEKIKDNDEYIKAMFDEAKKNYGFEGKPIKLTREESIKQHSAGHCARDNSHINVDKTKCSRKHACDTVHHEFRHAKQHEIMCNEYFDEYKKIVYDAMKTDGKMDPEVEQYMEELIDEYGDSALDKSDEIFQKVLEKFDYKITARLQENFGELSPNNVPEKYKEFAKKCMENSKNYVDIEKDYDGYLKQFVEVDARDAGGKMESIIKSFWNRLI